jgi:hypothetical protein
MFFSIPFKAQYLDIFIRGVLPTNSSAELNILPIGSQLLFSYSNILSPARKLINKKFQQKFSNKPFYK